MQAMYDMQKLLPETEKLDTKDVLALVVMLLGLRVKN
jgi:hypothetical protein